MWGGLECTVNRVGSQWLNQADRNGHDLRKTTDLKAFESLGITAIRYPVLWETVAPVTLDDPHFELTDDAMAFLKTSSIEPIVGLLHHGSGPHYTSLVDPLFAEKLATYAARVAERYPWVTYYTPVNEPLTTARFSGLYGVWYPHGRDDVTFVRSLYNEVRGTVLAMQAIRRVNPGAKLIQTDDLGRAVGTTITQPEVDFQNERRWLTFDLLLGRVDRNHSMYSYLTGKGGLTEEDLAWLVDNRCPPAVIGVNHYLLSNRFLDHEVRAYPDEVVKRDDSGDHADVPALQSADVENPSVEEVLGDPWRRYGDIPIAVTEVHVDGDPETQLQWLGEIWSAVRALKERGAPMVGVTAWSLLGTYDWNTLCTSPSDADVHYEPGVFDVSGGSPVETALTAMVRSLAGSGAYDHPALKRRGYWHQPNRIRYRRPQAL